MDKKKFDILDTLPIIGWAWPKIMVCYPLERTISYADLVIPSMMQIAAQGPLMLHMPYQRIDVARNKAAIALLKSDFTHLLMLDIDHVHPYNIVQRLARWVIMDNGIQVVGGLNYRRSEPHDPCAYRMDESGAMYAIEFDKDDSQLVEVDRLGTGSILIAREVFEKLELPWFYNIYDKVWDDVWPGEDIGFSRKCKAAGVRMWCDTTTTSPHITTRLIDDQSWRDWLEANPDALAKGTIELNEVRGK